MLRRAVLLALCCLAGLPSPGRAADAPAPAVTLNWVGDISFSRREGLPAGGPANVFSSVASLLRGGDITTGNLEGTLGSGGPSKCSSNGGDCFAFQAPAGYARAFARVGFDLFNVANNHSRDFGQSGIRQTRHALAAAGLRETGLRGEIRVVPVNGQRVAFLGFAPYPWASPLTDVPAASRMIRRAARRAPIVVVFIHAGAEGAGALHVPHGTEHAFGENRGETRRFAHVAVRSGADAVLGSGPHVLRGMECYRRRLIAYSLGNFVGYRTLSTSGVLGLSGVLRVRLAAGGALAGGRLFPVRLARPGVPRRDPSRASVSLVRRLSRADFGRRGCRIARDGTLALP
jgi:Bacterial capsule synthesis protein PGA_cap